MNQDFDFSLSNMMMEARKLRGRELTEAEKKEVTDHYEKIDAAKKERVKAEAEYQAALREEAADAEHQDVLDTIKKEANAERSKTAGSGLLQQLLKGLNKVFGWRQSMKNKCGDELSPAERRETDSPENEETWNKLEIERLEKENKEILGNKTLSDEQKLKLVTAAAEKTLAHWEKRAEDARNGKIKDQYTGKPLTSDKIKAIQVRRDAYRAEVKELKALDPASQASPEVLALNRRLTELNNRVADNLDRLARGDFKP